MREAYDKAAWHRDDPVFVRGEVPTTHVGRHISLYRTWLVRSGLAHPDLMASWDAGRRQPGLDENSAVSWDEPTEATLGREDLTEEGERFTTWYYARYYVEDIQRHLTKSRPAPHHVPDDPASFDKLARVLDSRLVDYRAMRERGEEPASFAENMMARVGRAADAERAGRERSEQAVEMTTLSGWTIPSEYMPYLWFVPLLILGALYLVFSLPHNKIILLAVGVLVVYSLWNIIQLIRNRPGR